MKKKYLDFPRTPSPVYKGGNLSSSRDDINGVPPPTSSSSSSSSPSSSSSSSTSQQAPQQVSQSQQRVFQPQPQQRSQLLQRQTQFSNSIVQPQPQQISPMYYPEPTLESNFQNLNLGDNLNPSKNGRPDQWNNLPSTHPIRNLNYSSLHNPSHIPPGEDYAPYSVNPYYSNIPQMYSTQPYGNP